MRGPKIVNNSTDTERWPSPTSLYSKKSRGAIGGVVGVAVRNLRDSVANRAGTSTNVGPPGGGASYSRAKARKSGTWVKMNDLALTTTRSGQDTDALSVKKDNNAIQQEEIEQIMTDERLGGESSQKDQEMRTNVEGVTNHADRGGHGHQHHEGHSHHHHHDHHHHHEGHGHRRTYSHIHFRVYKRRWFGLVQLVLLNIVISMNWLTFSPVSTTSAKYYRVSETAINWLSTGFMFAFVVMAPFTVWILNRGPKESIVWSSILMLLGSWIRYIGTRAGGGVYGVVMFGQIVVGMSQPFALAAPTRYSDTWFTESGRVSATAIASLANPFGAALAQLIVPFWATKESEMPNMVLYVAIISTIISIPGVFIPAKPPTPPSASSHLPKIDIFGSLRKLSISPSFYLILFPFMIYVGSFNAFSSLINQILYPYGYSETEAGICGALLIVVGLVAAAITSPLLDRSHAYTLGIKLLVPIIGLSYLALIWAPQTRTLAAPYVICSLLGASSFSLVPIALEYLVEVTFPASPEVGSTICWAGGQLVGCIYIIVMNALKDGNVDLKDVSSKGRGTGTGDRPPGNMYRALVFQAVFALAVVPAPMLLGIEKLGLGDGKVKGRLRVDEHREGGGEGGVVEEVDQVEGGETR